MTNNELLNASFLDILFDGRNKDYGAYRIRKTYDRTMLMSLGIGLSAVLLLVGLNSWKGNDKNLLISSADHKKDSVVIREYEVQPKPTPPVKPVIPNPPPAVIAKPVAAIEFPPFKLVKDHLADPTTIPTAEDLADKQVASKAGEGDNYNNQVIPTVNNPVGGNGRDSVTKQVEPGFLPEQASPEFPGGQAALLKFLSRNLQTPEELELGDKKMVKGRFIVNKDGSVSLVEIETSGGHSFDNEVIRVCRKMPKWKPAVQNGHPVAVSYVLPVTFISVEQ